MKNEDLSKRVKNQIIKGFLYWLCKYIAIFLSSAIAIVLITITVGTPIYFVFGRPDIWTGPIVGVACGCLTTITYLNRFRYQSCWMSMKINYLRYKTVKIILRCPIENWRYYQLQGYVKAQLEDFMEDYTL